MLDFMSLIVNIQSILSEVNLQPPYNYFPGSFVFFTIKVNDLCRVFVHLINVHGVSILSSELVCVNENKNRWDYCL